MTADLAEAEFRAEGVRPRGRSAWWRRPWVIPLAVLAAAVLVSIWSYYITFDPRMATVELRPEYPWKYPAVVTHIVFGTVAVITVVPQVWPWLVRAHPRVHRWVGRVYVVSVMVCSVIAGILLPLIAGPPWLAWASRVVLVVLWVWTTAYGVHHARRGDIARHRWYMLSSFALTMDAFSTRFLQVVLVPFFPAVIDKTTFLLIAGWGGWVTNLLLVQVWLYRTRSRSG